MAEVVFTRRARRDLDRLDSSIRRRILVKLRELSADPLASARKLTDPRIGTFRYRVGDYRIIFDLADDQVIVLRVGDRKYIYS